MAPAKDTTPTPEAEASAPSEPQPDIAEFDNLVRSRKESLPPEPERTAFDEVCQSILKRSPELTEEQKEKARQRHEQAMVRQARADRRAKLDSLFFERGERYLDCTLANFEVEHEQQKIAVHRLNNYAENMVDCVRDGESIVIFGPAGTGKDHLLAAMMRAAILRYGLGVRWENGMDLFGDIRDRMDTDRPEADLVRSLCHPDILALSDPLPPFGPLTPFQANMLFRVIDGRYSKGKPTWVTLNCASGEEAESRMGVQMVDRLRHGALTIFANWPSYRKAQ